MPTSEGQERRRFGRIDLDEPLTAFLGDARVEVAEVSIVGFRVLHEARFQPGEERELRVSWSGREMRFACEIVRSTLFRLAKSGAEKSIYQSGVRIERAVGDSEKILRDLIAERVIRALDEQKANARGMVPVGEYTYRVGKGDRFRRCELAEGRWRKFDTTRPEQPAEGFTISAETEPAEVDMLCRTYESTTAEGRRLTKMLAELSIRKTEGAATRRYIP
ncbi:MAG TPA: hypothetical protein VNA04_12540 [Thermoanaerobaculia bacterium]|nr:hypothetical protein [Thermoanaerobaculia bacterium]